MNYWKSALAGFGMSFIGTALCGAKVGTVQYESFEGKVKTSVLNRLVNFDSKGTPTIDMEAYNRLNDYQLTHCNTGNAYKLNFDNFEFVEYSNDYLPKHNFWYDKNMQHWSVAEAFLINNVLCIPSALLGAAFHDYYGKDLTKDINDYFKSDISPYLVDGAVFGGIGIVGMMLTIPYQANNIVNDLTEPWIYSLSLIEGFVIGAAAGFGAYFGDETTDKPYDEDSTYLDTDSFIL